MTRDQWRAFEAKGWVQTVELGLGILLLVAAIPVGVLPGPGGVFVAAAGLALVLRTSMWAKRRYVRFKRWQPKAGAWADWGLRRASHRRREALRKEQDAAADALTEGETR